MLRGACPKRIFSFFTGFVEVALLATCAGFAAASAGGVVAAAFVWPAAAGAATAGVVPAAAVAGAAFAAGALAWSLVALPFERNVGLAWRKRVRWTFFFFFAPGGVYAL